MEDREEQDGVLSSGNQIQVQDGVLGLPASELERIIDEWMIGETHAHRNRFITKKRLIDGIPYYDLIGIVEEKYKITMSDKQLRRIVDKGIKIIKRHLPK